MASTTVSWFAAPQNSVELQQAMNRIKNLMVSPNFSDRHISAPVKALLATIFAGFDTAGYVAKGLGNTAIYIIHANLPTAYTELKDNFGNALHSVKMVALLFCSGIGGFFMPITIFSYLPISKSKDALLQDLKITEASLRLELSQARENQHKELQSQPAKNEAAVDNTMANGELLKIQQQKTETEQQLQSLQEQIEKSRETLQQLEQGVVNLNLSHKTQKEQLEEEHATQIKEYQTALEQLAHQKEEGEQQLHSVQEQIKEIRSQYQSRKDEIELQTGFLTTRLDSAKQATEEESESIQKQIEALKSELLELNSEKTALLEDVSKLKSDKRKAQESIDRKMATIKEAEEALVEAQQTMSSLASSAAPATKGSQSKAAPASGNRSPKVRRKKSATSNGQNGTNPADGKK